MSEPALVRFARSCHSLNGLGITLARVRTKKPDSHVEDVPSSFPTIDSLLSVSTNPKIEGAGGGELSSEMQGVFPHKASASVTTSQITVSSSPSPPTPSSQTLTTPELDQSSLFGSPCSSGSVRRNKRPPPVKIPQYDHYPQPNDSSKLDFSRQSIVSTFSEGASSDEEDIPIYFGGLPAHLSARRPSPGIPMDATYEHSGFLSSRSSSFGRRSSSFGNYMPTSPIPKLSANSDQAESYRHPLDHLGYTADVTLIKGFYGPFNPFPRSAPATNKVDPFIAVTPPIENIGIGLGLHSSQRYRQARDLMSISLDKGLGKTIRGIQPGGLSVPASLQTSKLRREIGGTGHTRSESVDSTFTISAYQGLPSDTPHQQSVSRFENQLGEDQALLARHHMLLTDPVSPKTMTLDPPHTIKEPRSGRGSAPESSSPPSSTHAEAGFFLSQMDSYLAKHTSPHHPLRAPLAKETSFGSHQETASARSSKPTLMLDTSCLVPTRYKQAQSAVEATNRTISHLRDRSLSSGAGLTPVRRSIDQNTTIQLSIDQVSLSHDQSSAGYALIQGNTSRNRFEKSHPSSSTPGRAAPRRFKRAPMDVLIPRGA